MAGGDGQTVETVWMPGDDGAKPETTIRRTGKPLSEHDLRFQPSRMRRQLPILPDGEVGAATEFDRGRNCRTGLAVLERRRRARARSDQPGVYGQGEPFLNYDDFMKAVRLLVDEGGLPNRG